MMLWKSHRSWHPLFGLLSGLALTAACLVLPVSSFDGQVILVVLPVVAVVLYLPSPHGLFRLVVLTLAIYGPTLLVLPGVTVLQGAITTMVGVTSVGMLGYPALHDAVVYLPLPGIVKLLLLQILHQASILFRETGKIRQAIAVRGALPRGFSGWQFLHALPRVWIPRVVFKANRVAHALEVRGYGMPIPRPQSRQLATVDVAGLVVSVAALCVAGALRWIL